MDIQAEARKDELTLAIEANQKEMAEIREQGKRKELEIQKQILQEEIAMAKGAIQVLTPGFFPRAVAERVKARPWEAVPHQNIFNINIEGEVVEEDALIRRIIDAIDRASELKVFIGE